ncbi:LLM class flavin-dependent oxidoreductase [Haloechinothrix salitolerans]|uniref:LLM class flavin-dependent oxidoreductase n=1 Tax=Haloechinothrix salitolerans TaxID=926830 RepID=A0ABW2BUX9_9PSEU
MSGIPVGAFIATATAPNQIGPLARRAEDLGYSEVWVAEDYFCYGGFTGAALALGATSQVKVGLGVAASVVRHPAVTAMEIATLALAHPGRFLPGVGHGVPFWTDQMGVTAKSPLTALTECVNSIRGLLAGDTIDAEGKQFAFHAVSLAHRPETEVPILTGVLGPKSLKLSGKIADGTVMSVLCGTKYLDFATEHITAGMNEGGRKDHLIPTFALFSINKDGKTAKAAVRQQVALYLSAVGPHNALTAPFGYNDQLRELLERGGADLLAREMPDEWVNELAVAGDPDEVTERIERLLAAGATSVVLSPVDGDAAAQQLQFCADTVFPALSR